MKKTHFSEKHFQALCAVLLLAAIGAAVLFQYFSDCAELRSEVLRLHIIAASDSERDQSVKLKVRDEILKSGAEIFDGSVTAAQAQEKIRPYTEKLESAANAVLRENGCDYTAQLEIVNEYFDSRQYGDKTLPAGKYEAVKIILGGGSGKNWWCVMFPPLCLPAVTQAENESYAVFSGAGAQVVSGGSEYKVRFKIVEIVEKFIDSVRSREK